MARAGTGREGGSGEERAGEDGQAAAAQHFYAHVSTAAQHQGIRSSAPIFVVAAVLEVTSHHHARTSPSQVDLGDLGRPESDKMVIATDITVRKEEEKIKVRDWGHETRCAPTPILDALDAPPALFLDPTGVRGHLRRQ